ncbi:transposase [Pseudofrankia saprophytica]|uniref:transposase n=1 Tax=Pseudofrankia saprophytica TaxID=298655 RepID=UPI003158C292
MLTRSSRWSPAGLRKRRLCLGRPRLPRARPRRTNGSYRVGIGQAQRRQGRTWIAPAHPHGSGLGCQRLPVERTIGWIRRFRRLRTRWERRADIHQAFLTLACSIICLRKLKGSF